MAGRKKLINNTGKDLKVILVIRKGDHPDDTAGTLNVDLSAGTENESGEAQNSRWVEYGDDVNIYLNGIEVELFINGISINQRRIVLERGIGLDNDLNTNDTIEFLFDDYASNILITTSNTGDQPFEFKAEAE